MQTVLEATHRAAPRWRYLPFLVLAAALSACATAATNDSRDGSYVHQSEDSYVRLVPSESGAPPNSHPFAISANRLSRLLAPVKVAGAASARTLPVFTPEELETIAPPLASALSKAGPDQDVTFAVTGRRGIFGWLASKTTTTGRLFVRGDGLNLIFGLMHQRTDAQTLDYNVAIPEIVPGTRDRRIDVAVWKIEPGSGEFHEQRGDWLVFDRSAIPAASAAPAARPASGADAGAGSEAPAAPTAESKAQEIENKLRVLDVLKERDVITEQEYRERRRAILEQF